jgi:hypothetical protein
MSGKWSRKQRARFNATIDARPKKKRGKRKPYRKPGTFIPDLNLKALDKAIRSKPYLRMVDVQRKHERELVIRIALV